MPETPEQPHTAETPQQPTAALRLSIAGEGASAAEPRELALWLREDPDLEAAGMRVSLVAGPADEAMGLGEDVLVTLVMLAAETAVFELFRAIINHLRNRSNGARRVSVQVGDGMTLTLDSERRYSRRELRQLAERAARAIQDDDRGAQ